MIIHNGLTIKSSAFGTCPDEAGNSFFEGMFSSYTPIIAYSGPTTVAAADLIANKVIELTCSGATNTLTLPTATLLAAALPSGFQEGYAFQVSLATIATDGTHTATVAAGVGGTIVAGKTVLAAILPSTYKLTIVVTGITIPAYKVYIM